MLLLQSVTDYTSGKTFTFPAKSKWTIVVEMPSVLGQQNIRNDVDNIEEFLKKTIPVLSLVSKTHEPSSKFDVDTKVEHVCKYLF